MLPSQLSTDDFKAYPPRARQIAEAHLAILRSLPLPFLAVFLQELVAYDWRFPAERRELEDQLSYLGSLSKEQLDETMAPFERLQLSSELEHLNWAAAPAQFVENLTSHLWATHQIDSFRAAATEYMQKARAAAPKATIPTPRLGIVVIGRGVKESRYRLFRRLRPHGVYFNRLNPENGWRILCDAVTARAAAHPLAYGHWYIDGAGTERPPDRLVTISWNSLAPLRATLLDRIRKAKQSGEGSEAVRSMLARLDAQQLKSGPPEGDAVLERFQVSLLTEGSGTQLYSTTFVQWAAREASRRAQPVTLLARFAPRERELSLGEVLSNPNQERLPDPQGSLIDADMGAYYTWLSQQRLSKSEEARFLVWFEDHAEALAIAPSLQGGTECNDRIDLRELLRRVG